ncbi:MFS transporter [Halomarina pelagica]|uniref:MFS transporter n=1 Tax=Halomarina pelagica TaxID=2961599 RepID=UPI0020C2C64D|nr:MFS transporter [Halomarina sp. BND7]
MVIRRLADALWPWRYRAGVLTLCTAVYFGVRLSTALVSALSPQIVAALGMSLGAFGFAITGIRVTAAALQLPSGILSDRYGERRVILAAVVVAGTGTVLLALAPSHGAFLAVAILLGVGGGLYYSPSTALLDSLYDRTGRAIGVFRTGGQVAGIVAPLLVVGFGVRHGWRSALLLAGIPLVPIAVGLLFLVRSAEPLPPTASPARRIGTRRVRSILARPPIATSVVLACLVQFVDVASFALLPAGLQGYHDLPPGAATAVYGGYFVAGALGQPVTGWLADRYGNGPTLVATLLAGIVGFGLLSYRLAATAVVGAVCLAGFSRTWATPVQSRILDHLSADERGTGFGLVRTVYLLVGALGSAVVGTIATAAGWRVVFGALAGLLATCLAFHVLAIAPDDSPVGGRAG